MFLSAIATGFMTGAGLIVAIGAQNAFVLRQGLERRHIGAVVAVCSLSDIVLIVCGAAGMGALVLEWPQLLQMLRFGGAAFLGGYGCFAAQRAWRGAASLPANQNNEATRWRVLLTCLALTFLNPHVYLDTVVLLGSLSTHYAGKLQSAFALGACAASVTWFLSLGYGAHLLQPIFQDPRAWRVLDGSIAILMWGLCLLLLLRPLS